MRAVCAAVTACVLTVSSCALLKGAVAVRVSGDFDAAVRAGDISATCPISGAEVDFIFLNKELILNVIGVAGGPYRIELSKLSRPSGFYTDRSGKGISITRDTGEGPDAEHITVEADLAGAVGPDSFRHDLQTANTKRVHVKAKFACPSGRGH